MPYKQWQRENDAVSSLASDVGIIYPSLYTFYDDVDGWVRVAKENIAEARRISHGKPVMPFLWPQYHDSAHALAFQPLPKDFWERQLATVHSDADGVVIWGGWDFKNHKVSEWDEGAEWWTATKEFLQHATNICRK